MGTDILALVLVSAFMHPFWNLLVKKNPDPLLGYLFLTITLALCGLAHGLYAGADFSAIFTVLPFLALSVGGQILYGTGLTATLKRGDLSAYYPIIRASPVFVVIVSVLFLGKTYSLIILLGIALALLGGFLLLYRRGARIFDNPTALGFALLALCGTGIYSLADAHMVKTVSPQVQIFFVESLLFPVYATLWFRQRAAGGSPAVRINGAALTRLLVPGIIAYASYYLILLAYQMGGEVAIVTSVRQASIPISVALGGLFLREGAMLRRFFAAGVLALGIVIIAMNG